MGATDNSFWIRIQQGLREAEMLMNQKQYNMAMIKARQTLENMVNCLGEKALIVEGDLADSIDQLFERRFISQASKDHYHRIRVLGNKAVHDGNDSPYDAEEAFRLLSQEVQTFANAFGERKQRPTDVRAVPIASRNSSVRSGVSGNEAQKAGTQRSGEYSTPYRAGEHSGTYRTSEHSGAARGGEHSGTYRTGERSGAARSGEHSGAARSGERSGAARPSERSGAARPGERSGAERTGQHSGGTRTGQRPPQRSGSRSGQRVSAQSKSRRRPKKRGFDIYDLVKPGLIFLVLLVVVLIAVKLIPGKNDKKETTASEPSTQMTTEAMETTEAMTTETEPETEAPKVYTTKSKLNVRSEPSTDGTKLGSLAAGTVVEYVDTYDDKWTIITFEGKQAYVATEFLTVTDGETAASAEDDQTAESQTTAAQ